MIIKDLKNEGYRIVATPGKYHVDYAIYELLGFSVPSETPLFPKKDSISSEEMADTIEESEAFISGSVKWDGCSNWNMEEAKRCCIHACDRQGLLNIGIVLAVCWDWTKELCPHWDGDEER